EVAREVEPAALGNPLRFRDCLWMVIKQLCHFGRWFEKVLRVLTPQLMAGVERRPVLDRDERILEPVPLSPVVMDVSGRDDVQLHARLSALVVEMRVRQQPAKVRIAARRLAQQREVILAIFLATCSLVLAPRKCYLRPRNRPQPPGPRALRELHRAVKAVVVSQRERLVPKLQRS